MSPRYRSATRDDVPAAARLVAHSFPRGDRSPEWWAEQLSRPLYGGGPEILWVGEEAGRTVAVCELHPLRAWIAGTALPTMGLGTVAISPAHRKRGIAGDLVATGVRRARERGDVVSSLFPFRVSFYQRLGYGLAGEVIQYIVAPDNFADAEERAGVELADTPGARAEVRALYERWAPTQTGQIVRSERVWESLLAPSDRALVVFRDGGRAEGYALVAYRTDLPLESRFLDVVEIAWLTPAARRGLYAWLGSLGDQWWRVAVRALPSQRLGDWLREPRLPAGSAPSWNIWSPSATLMNGPMLRIVHLENAWRARAVAPDAALTVALDVHDAAVPENGGEWRLRLENGRVSVERGGGAADVTLRLGIDVLSRLFVGALSPAAALDAGLARADGAALDALGRALALPEPWTFDRY